ncbi:MAG: hypothetical protein JOY71_23845 [Acetobacteraceae bacterium]|nr:hypothetical protein [Acetobacteraceae bacterium]
MPDYVVRLDLPGERYLIAELKGEDRQGLAGVKAQAAERWCTAINGTGAFGRWNYLLAMSVGELVRGLDQYVNEHPNT